MSRRTYAGDSLHDLTDPANLSDAREAFRRARDLKGAEALLAWTIEWGEAALAALGDMQTDVADCDDDGEGGLLVPEGWALVPLEPTEAMTDAAAGALAAWREGLGPDEKLLRHVIKDGRGYTEATEAEKHAIRWRAMVAAAPELEGEA